jgi:CheY-like chemotaxis protein
LAARAGDSVADPFNLGIVVREIGLTRWATLRWRAVWADSARCIVPFSTRSRKEPPIANALRAARVLIVDDEESICRFAERVLRFAGYETRVAASGPEALRIAEDQGPFDLVLADLVMPGMLGDEMARQLRAREPDLKILYFTGYSDRLFSERSVLWENEAFVEKPVGANALLEAVALLLFGHIRQGPHGPVADRTHCRNLRVGTAPLQVRVGQAVGVLLNISATGALVRMPDALALTSEWPMAIEVESEPVELRVCVVRSHALSVPTSNKTEARPEHAVALVFTELSAKTETALKELCGEAFSQQG